MSSLQHFSHEHLLIFNEEKSIDEEIHRDQMCQLCSLPILLSSSYSCSFCKYFLHKPCALLPQQKDLPCDAFRRNKYDLVEHRGKHDCTICHEPCEKLHYCDAANRYKHGTHHVHPLCAAKMEIKSWHKSHPLHPLIAVCRATSALCDACGNQQRGYFFSCHPCGFWIHVDCALLPRFAKCRRHSHHLILSYYIQHEDPHDFYADLSLSYISYFRCIICSEDLIGSGIYFCVYCRRYAHLSCVAESMESEAKVQVEITDLPFDDFDALWSRMIQNLQKLMLDQGHSAYDHNLLHDHGLILYQDDDHGINSVEPYTSKELVYCNTCIQPIYPPFYACPQSQSDEYNFHLHEKCSQLPFRTELPFMHDFPNIVWTLISRASPCSLFQCFYCQLPGNGLSYSNDFITIDIPCLSASKFIKHESHWHHILHLIKSSNITFRCCYAYGTEYSYVCVDCDFGIHLRCSMLPKQVKHKFDIHPLNLITTGIINDATKSSDYYICEFCEENINTKFWYYGCEECDNLFHIKCIPSVGYLSRVKFGSSITVPCHPHRVTFVRMLGYGSQKCGYCKESIQGFVDDMAFHCSKCDFWMHFDCAEECIGDKKKVMRNRRMTMLKINSVYNRI